MLFVFLCSTICDMIDQQKISTILDPYLRHFHIRRNNERLLEDYVNPHYQKMRPLDTVKTCFQLAAPIIHAIVLAPVFPYILRKTTWSHNHLHKKSNLLVNSCSGIQRVSRSLGQTRFCGWNLTSVCLCYRHSIHSQVTLELPLEHLTQDMIYSRLQWFLHMLRGLPYNPQDERSAAIFSLHSEKMAQNSSHGSCGYLFDIRCTHHDEWSDCKRVTGEVFGAM